MIYLLDTHAMIWSLMYSSKLSTNLKEVIADRRNTVFVSTISFWEISLKYSLGKLDLSGITPDALPDLTLQAGFKHLPLYPEEVGTYHQLQGNWHKDPFDKMLIWQAIQKNIILISKDENVLKYQSAGLKVIW